MHIYTFLVVALKTQRPPTKLRLFHSQNKRSAARYGKIFSFFFCVHNITETKESNRQGGTRAVDLPARSFDLARHGVALPLTLRNLD